MTHTSVRRTQQIIDAREFQEWQEYYKQEPFGDDWAEAATIAAAVVNGNPFSKRRVKPEQFIPKHREPLTEAQLHAWARRYNERIEKGNK